MEWKEVESRNVNLLTFSAIIRQETWREVEENNVQHMCGQDFQACIRSVVAIHYPLS